MPAATTTRRRSELPVRYVGCQGGDGPRVWVQDDRLRRPLHTDTTPAWGRRGPATAALARAILLDATDNPALVEARCRPFVHEVLATLPPDGFSLTRDEVLAWVEAHAAAPAAA
ncbi:DUF6166 domain-containing protein [Conexibacter sp. SYSU D00693]|uniref:DUF6166 domain-containing protein n=1 Tax=Conexibacter sp. SYSU D00693 TaxID=2812560 RepID=UPI00196B4C4A|nr:DUF6166 domain-containing protein [Conexibacter sp. SYSU D00693]